MPQILHAVKPSAPKSRAPPTPPTTPPMTLLELGLRPEPLPLLLLESKEVATAELVVCGTTVLPVDVAVRDWPLVNVVNIVVYS